MTDLILTAAAFAAKKHTHQCRKGGSQEPYINHPLEVAYLIRSVGKVDDEEILAAALLHDTVEDTDATPEEISRLFGERVAAIVAEVTDDESLPKEERKRLQVEHAASISPGAKLIKLGDKISNVTDIASDPPAGWDTHRRLEYVAWSEKVVEQLRGTNEDLEAMFSNACEETRKIVSSQT